MFNLLRSLTTETRSRGLARGASIAAVALLLFSHRPEAVDAQAQLVLKIASTAAQRSPLADHLRAVGADVVARSQGTTHVKVFTDGVLGDDHRLIARTIEGSIQMFAGELQSLAETVPEVAVLSGPFVFGDARRTDRALDGAVRRRLQPALERRGLVFGGWAGSAERVLLSREPITGMEAFEGAVLQTTTPRPALWAQALGCAAAGPLQTAGGTDAPVIVDATPLDAAAGGFHRDLRHVLAARHALDLHVLVFSKRWFDGLPADAQRDLRRPEADLTAAARARLRDQQSRVLEAFREDGLQVRTPTKTERRSLIRALRDVPGKLAQAAGNGAHQLWKAAR